MSALTSILKDLSDEQLIVLALASGWSADTTSLYNEEGVEGWRWVSSDDKSDLSCIGQWDHPRIDSPIREAIIDDLAVCGVTQNSACEGRAVIEASIKGHLFETKSGKYLELTPSNARFHSAAERATPVAKADFDDLAKRRQLLDHHNVDWYFGSIIWQAA
jgi:hypothetical protein